MHVCIHRHIQALKHAHTQVMCLLLYVRESEKYFSRDWDMVTHTKTMNLAPLNIRIFEGNSLACISYVIYNISE
jgi:hypothetical protein